MWYSTDGEDQIWFQLEAISLFLINVMAEKVFFLHKYVDSGVWKAVIAFVKGKGSF